MNRQEEQIEYDIALSFAGEDRDYVHQVAYILQLKGVSVFYDQFEETNLWGKNLYDYLCDIYRNKAYFTIMFVSANYKNKLWTNHEREAMQSRAIQENREYVLPARFDDTEIPGLLPTIGYISLNDKSAEEFCEIICEKLISSGRTIPSEQIRKNQFPFVLKSPKICSNNFSVVVKNARGESLIGADIYLLADNNTYLSRKTNEDGKAVFAIKTRRIYKLFFADANYPAYIVTQIDPVYDMEICVLSSENVGSIVCDGTGYIPGLQGRLNPILDKSNRTYLYAHNIAINGGLAQPVGFKVNVPMVLEDCDGTIMRVTVKDIQGSISLIEFVKPIIEGDSF